MPTQRSDAAPPSSHSVQHGGVRRQTRTSPGSGTQQRTVFQPTRPSIGGHTEDTKNSNSHPRRPIKPESYRPNREGLPAAELYPLQLPTHSIAVSASARSLPA